MGPQDSVLLAHSPIIDDYNEGENYATFFNGSRRRRNEGNFVGISTKILQVKFSTLDVIPHQQVSHALSFYLITLGTGASLRRAF